MQSKLGAVKSEEDIASGIEEAKKLMIEMEGVIMVRMWCCCECAR